MSDGFRQKGRLFKVEFTIWLDERVCLHPSGYTDGMAVYEALVVDREYDGWVLDWQEQEIIVTDPREEEAPEVVLVEAPKGQTLEEWQEEMAELRQRAREAINEHEA